MEQERRELEQEIDHNIDEAYHYVQGWKQCK